VQHERGTHPKKGGQTKVKNKNRRYAERGEGEDEMRAERR